MTQDARYPTVVGCGKWHGCFDEFERMVGARGSGLSKESAVYDYDGLDRRDSKVERTTSGTDKRQDYGYVGTTRNLSREQTADGRTLYYDYNSSGEREGHSKAPSAGLAVYRSFGKDANGSVEDMEDPDGQVPAGGEYVYDPYGERDLDTGQEGETGLTDSARENPFRFEGFYYDSGVKTYDMQARQYRSDTGRFLSSDQYEQAGADLNLQADTLTQSRYAFAGGNPVNNIEFDGHGTANNSDEVNCNGKGGCTNLNTGEPTPGSNDTAPPPSRPINPRSTANTPATSQEKASLRRTIRQDISTVRIRKRTVKLTGRQRGALARSAAREYCLRGDFCSSEDRAENTDRIRRALDMGGGSYLDKLDLRHQTTDVGLLNPVDLVASAGAAAGVKLAIKAAGSRVVAGAASEAASAGGSGGSILRRIWQEETGSVGSGAGRRRFTTPLTNSQASDLAEWQGFRDTGLRSRGQKIFQRGRREFITQDSASHNGGVWKMARSPSALGKRSTRLGTYDERLNRIGD